MFALTLVGALWAMTVHLGKPLLGPHAFRQTQTAISADYMAKDPWLFTGYITPVLGKPWRIPMELPIYQWVVARWHNVTGMDLDPSGKLVSVIAWLACLGPIWVLLRSLRFTRDEILLSLVVLLSSPLYLFWSNAFLIESTGLFLSLSMVACVVHGHAAKSPLWLVAGFLFGVLAIMCKATTWVPAVGVGMLLLLFREGMPRWPIARGTADVQASGEASGRRDAMILAAAITCLVLPFVAGKLWLSYGDAVKAANPFARHFLMADSPHQSQWNYGTWAQKVDPATWQVVWRHVTDQLLAPFPLIGPFLMALILVLGCVGAPRRIPLILVFLAGFLAGPLIFTNLYFEHSYYWMANGIWLLLAVGTAIAGISEGRPGRAWPQIAAVALAAVVALAGFGMWFQKFLPILNAMPTQEQIAKSWTEPVQRIVPPDRSLLIVGHDWNPVGLYYAQRKGIAQPSCDGIRFPGPEFAEAIRLLGPDAKLGAVVFADPLLKPENEAALGSVLRQLGMSFRGERTALGMIFPAEDVIGKASPD